MLFTAAWGLLSASKSAGILPGDWETASRVLNSVLMLTSITLLAVLLSKIQKAKRSVNR